MEFPDIEHLKKIEITGLPLTNDPSEIAWLIAIIEGEGYFSYPKSTTENSNYHPFRIRIVMCDKDVIDRIAEYAGVSWVVGPVKPHKSSLGKKPYYVVNIENARAYFLLKAGWKWLGERRRKRAHECIKAWSTIVSPNEGIALNAEKVSAIKQRLRDGDQGRTIAREYGVSDAIVSRIKLNQAWRHVS